MNKRPGTMSDDERALVGARHRTPPRGVLAWEDVTDQYEGEALLAARTLRAEQNPAHRIALIETEQKEQAKHIAEIKLSVAEIRGDQKAQNASLTAINSTLERMAEREHVTFAAKVDVDAAKAKDAIDAAKVRRDAIIKVVLYLVTGGLLGKILHSLGML